MPDWSQLIKILPAIGSMTQGGPEFEAFMQGYQQTLQLLERQKLAQREMGNREAETGLMRDRFAAQDARTTADDARQDRREQGQGIESLLSMVPGLADDATAVPPPLTVPTPFGDLPSIGALIPGVRQGAQAESVGESLRALAPMMGVEPGLVDRMGPFLRPAVSRAEAARQNRRRKAIEAAVALAEKRQDVEALQQSDADVTFEVDGQEDRLPYSKALQEAKLPPVKATPKAEERSPAYREYLDAKREGYAGTFSQYQTEDANRKRPVTSADPESRRLANELAQLRLDEARKKADSPSPQTAEQIRKRDAVVASTSRTLDAIDEILDANGRLKPEVTAAVGGSRYTGIQKVAGTDAYNAQAAIDRVRARLVTDLMAELKAQSRTGATGFGQLNLQELKIIQDSAAKLDPGQSEAVFAAELKKIRDRLELILKEPTPTAAGAPKGKITILKVEEVK